MSDKEALSTEPYKGVRDFYPTDWRRFMAVVATTRKVLESYGYEEYQASPLERAEIYEAKGNEEIINEQTYTFTDRGDRRVTLRPEMTPTLARMVAGKRRELPFPLRFYSIGNRFRYERPQRGRLREFYQTDIDFVGLPEGDADLEIIELAATIIKSFGAKESDFIIRINSRALLSAASKAAGLNDENLKQYWLLLDKKAKMTPEAFAAARATLPGDPLRIIEEGSDPTVEAEKQKLLARIELLKERGITNVVYDESIVRGFDYYTGMVFEVNDTDPRNPRALFGGGRYDGLVTLFGGDPIPAVGFAFGDVTMMDFLETHNLLPENAGAQADLYLGTPNRDRNAARMVANTLRASGLRVFVNLSEKGLGDQIKDAVKRGIPYFAAVGDDEAKSGMLKLKQLATSTEESVSVADAALRIRGRSGS